MTVEIIFQPTENLLLKPRLGLINFIWTLHQQNQPLRSSLLNLNEVKFASKSDACSGRPKEAVSDENIKKVHKIILNDRKVKLIEIAETLKILKKRVEHIVNEYFDMQKLCAIDQNQQRVDDSEQCLAIFNRNKDKFVRRYITMDLTWLFHKTLEFNRQSAEWTERDEPNPRRGKTQSAGISITRCAWYYIHRLL
jgi:hypothetical protein